MLAYNEVVPKKYIVLDGEPYEVVSSRVFGKQRQKPTNQTKIKSLRTGKVTERVFRQSDMLEEADIEKRTIKYLYNNRGELWFCDIDNPRNRFTLSETCAGDTGQFLTENTIVEALDFAGETIGITLPIKIDLTVSETSPNVKGNTAQGGSKPAKLSSGAVITVPLFIHEGDVVRVNTETGEYVERVEKN